MARINRQLTPEELINRSLGNILSNIKYLSANSKGVRAAYYGRLEDLRKECLRIVNAVERKENKDG